MTERASVAIEPILARGVITDGDVLTLRRCCYGDDGAIDRPEAEALLALNAGCPEVSRAWGPFFIEALTDHIVDATPPEGYVTAENAQWLIGALKADTRAVRPVELELMVSVLEKARWSPASLVTCALGQVKHTVLNGAGPTRRDDDSPRDAAAVTNDEVALLRRILYAFGGDGGVAITRAEADTLFEINDAIASGPANAAFTDLFCKAVANAVMAASGYRVPPRQDALAAQAWLERRGDLSPAGILASIVHTGLGGVWGAYTDQTAEERALARLERQRIEIITNEEITEGEAGWLAERMGRDGRLTPNEAALVAYLKTNGTRLHPALAACVDRLARAA